LLSNQELKQIIPDLFSYALIIDKPYYYLKIFKEYKTYILANASKCISDIILSF